MARFEMLVAVGLVAAACSGGAGGDAGDGDDDEAGPTRTPTTAEPTETTTTIEDAGPLPEPVVESYDVPEGARPHDVWAGPDGIVWYTGQGNGTLGALDPESGDIREIPLGPGSRPHGVIVGPDDAPWITDGGLNAIVRVDPATDEVTTYPLPATHPDANLNTATFDADGTLWFTGQAGMYGRLPPGGTEVEAFDSPGGAGPYGITTTPDGDVYYASLAGSHVAQIDTATGEATVLEPPTPDQGTRRVWSDSEGRIWGSQWNAGQVSVYDPADGSWNEWPLPDAAAQAYAVYVDENDLVWLSDFGTNAMVRFNPATEEFKSIPLPSEPSDVRQIHGRSGEVWGAESAADRLVVLRTG
ncbi:MAG TPA: SMP-30/gluconolactonase/LRE family protein [Acidimicrobiia bacterium]|nr:SMP-30/gluconolactonase/LRE family protein [Acidimicrobiia bacterium]